MRNVAYSEPLALDIAIGATAPTAEVGTEIWSTIDKATLTFNGVSWERRLASGSVVSIAVNPPQPVLGPGASPVLGVVDSRAAREDHQHVFPVAAVGQAGAVSAAVFSKMDLIVRGGASTASTHRLTRDTLPTKATDGVTDYFGTQDLASRPLLWLQSATDGANEVVDAHTLQTSIHDSAVRLAATPYFGSNAFVNIGMPTAFAGAPVARAYNATSVATRSKRIGIPTSSVAGSSAGVRCTQGFVSLGRTTGVSGSNVQGFLCCIRMNLQLVNNLQHRFFVGLAPVAGGMLGNANPSAHGALQGFGCDSGETVLSIFSGPTKQSTGITWRTAFPAAEVVEFYVGRYLSNSMLWCGFGIRRVASALAAPVLSTVVVPATYNEQLYAPMAWWNNGTTASTDIWDVHHIYYENDF